MSESLTYRITHTGEIGAGIHPYDDEITITIDSGDPGGEDGEFAEFMRECLADWFDGAGVDRQ